MACNKANKKIIPILKQLFNSILQLIYKVILFNHKHGCTNVNKYECILFSQWYTLTCMKGTYVT